MLLERVDLWKAPYKRLLTTNTTAKLQGVEPWLCISQLKRAPPDIWSCANVGDRQIKLTRKKSSWHGGLLFPPKMPDQDFMLQLKMKPLLLLFLSVSLALFWKYVIIHTFQAITKER